MKHLPIWKLLPQIALDLLFPLRCVGCGKTGDSLCPDCRQQLPRLNGNLCPRCSRPLGNLGICLPCQKWPLAIETVRAPFSFDGVVRQVVYSFKYHHNRSLAAPLAELLSDYWRSHSLSGEVLVPVPLHRSRLRYRGYNQSELLARELGVSIGRPVITTALTRRRNTPPQARIATAEERWANAAGTFECHSPVFRGKRVVLVDDVCTTGATLEAAARVVLSAGASSVWGLTVAREV